MQWLEQLRTRYQQGLVPTVPAANGPPYNPAPLKTSAGFPVAISPDGTPGTEAGKPAPPDPDHPAGPYILSVPSDARDVDAFLRQKYDGLPLLTLDFETYFDPKFNLKKVAPLHYVTDPRFKMHGLAIRQPDGVTSFRTDVGSALRELRGHYGERLERAAVVMHNAYFDALILALLCRVRIANVVDTMLLSRLHYAVDVGHDLHTLAERLELPAKGNIDFMSGVRNPSDDQLRRLTEYAVHDTELTYTIATLLLPRALKLPRELWCMGYTVDQFVGRPLAVDVARLKEGELALDSEVSEALKQSGCTPKDIRSPVKLARLLDVAMAPSGRRAPRKKGAKGEILALSKKDPDLAVLMNDPDPRVRALVTAKQVLASESQQRSRLKFLETYAARLSGVHLQLQYARAVTGRFQGAGGFNVQNFSKRPAFGVGVATAIRRAICAPPGHILVAADASQIEARILALMAGEGELHAAFANGTDVYSVFASEQFREEVRKSQPSDPPEISSRMKGLRQVGKQAILGLGYGMGVERFEQELRAEPLIRGLFESGVLNLEKIAAIHGVYRKKYPRIKQFWHSCETAFRNALTGRHATVAGCVFGRDESDIFIRLPSGRRILYAKARLSGSPPEPKSYIGESGEKKCFTPDSREIVYGKESHVYGGLLAENIVQAVARDILVHVIYQLERQGLSIFLHCHDQVVACVADSDEARSPRLLRAAWESTPAWAPAGLVLAAETGSSKTLDET